MKIPKLLLIFLAFACVVVYLTYIRNSYEEKKASTSAFYTNAGISSASHKNKPTSGKKYQYGIMFDAGSTGTRIHVFTFLLEPREAPKLAHEAFKAIKPGLSAYADDKGLMELLEVAKENIPEEDRKMTPLVLKATAGLRLLPGEKADHLLNKVREVFDRSPFLSREDSVSIMDGTDEGVSAWITVNFLIGGLHAADTPTVGMLDLGGGSTQITFAPQDEKTIQTSPIDYITSFKMFNLTYTLYSHSPCLPPDYTGQWEHAEVTYTIKGQKPGTAQMNCLDAREVIRKLMWTLFSGSGEPIYESCLKKVEKMLFKKVKKAEDTGNMEFYAFSYYYDKAVDLGIIDEKNGGSIRVSDYIDGAKRVCSSLDTGSVGSPFTCLDLTYISVLLQELGFPTNKVFKLARKINGVETSWALGATFHYIETLRNQ
uniref:nucleoside diphosphate phosphatase n=1 Tax=Denticeps clupeoides TaxID=299321 RepID=A0AAY4E8C8_9TELE